MWSLNVELWKKLFKTINKVQIKPLLLSLYVYQHISVNNNITPVFDEFHSKISLYFDCSKGGATEIMNDA